MQVKKYEAPTLQEALDNIKRELGPDAIILQTKTYKSGFGLMSKGSVEVTVAISDKSLHKKKWVDSRLPDQTREQIQKLPADRQAEIYEEYLEKQAQRSAAVRSNVGSNKPANTARTATQAQVQQRMAQSQSQMASAPQTSYAPAQVRATRAPAPATQTMSSGGGEMMTYGQAASLTEKRYVDIEDEPPQSVQVNRLEEELRLMKRMLEEVKNAQQSDLSRAGTQALPAKGMSLSTLALQEMFEMLIVSGVDKRQAYKLVKTASFELGEKSEKIEEVMDQVAHEMIEAIRVEPLLDPMNRVDPAKPQIVVAVGPTGVGKTTTIAKIASEALLKRKMKVALINLDTYKVGAFDQLVTYAKILNIPFRSAGSVADLTAALQEFAAYDLILVDTTGRSHRDVESIQEMQKVVSQLSGARIELVLSATTRDTELAEMMNRFSCFKPSGLIISKLDEASVYGGIYNLTQKSALPLTYFTTGQRVPEDIEEATAERLVALVMDI